MSFRRLFDPAFFTRWVGRMLASAVFVTVMFFAMGEGLLPVNLLTLATFTILAGCVFAWFSDRYGGLIILTGIVFFYTISYAMSNRLPSGYVFPLVFVPGVLLLISDVLQPRD